MPGGVITPDRPVWVSGGPFAHMFLLWERIELLGLVDLLEHTRATRPRHSDCPCGEPGCGHVPTLRTTAGVRPCDHVFATPELVERLVECSVPDQAASAEAWSISRHRPVVATFDV